MTTADAPFDQTAIEISSTETEPNDWRIQFKVPAEQVFKFARQLRGVKPDIHPQELATLLIQVSLDEALHRLDRDRFWPFVPAPDSELPVFHRDKPFVGTFLSDAFAMPEWPDFSLITLSLPPEEVEEALVEREMLDQRLDTGCRAPLDGPLSVDDECDVSAEVRLPTSEDPVITVPTRAIRVPAAGQPVNLGGIVLDGAEVLAGQSAGETVDFETELPMGLPSPELDGRRAEVRLRIHATRSITPAEESEVVARFGSPNAANLRMQIRFALEQRQADERRRLAGRQILDQLQTFVSVPVPERIQKALVEARCAKIRKELETEGLATEELENRVDQARQRIAGGASVALSKNAIQSLLRLHFGITFSEEDLLAEVRKIADRTGRRPEDVRNEMVERGDLKTLEHDAILDRVADTILDKATLL